MSFVVVGILFVSFAPVHHIYDLLDFDPHRLPYDRHLKCDSLRLVMKTCKYFCRPEEFLFRYFSSIRLKCMDDDISSPLTFKIVLVFRKCSTDTKHIV